jgi:hypothetical protein
MRGRTIALTVLGVLLLVLLLGVAGTADLQSEVIQSQRQVIDYYDEVLYLELGEEKYDSLLYTDDYIRIVDAYYEDYGDY